MVQLITIEQMKVFMIRTKTKRMSIACLLFAGGATMATAQSNSERGDQFFRQVALFVIAPASVRAIRWLSNRVRLWSG